MAAARQAALSPVQQLLSAAASPSGRSAVLAALLPGLGVALHGHAAGQPLSPPPPPPFGPAADDAAGGSFEHLGVPSSTFIGHVGRGSPNHLITHMCYPAARRAGSASSSGGGGTTANWIGGGNRNLPSPAAAGRCTLLPTSPWLLQWTRDFSAAGRYGPTTRWQVRALPVLSCSAG